MKKGYSLNTSKYSYNEHSDSDSKSQDSNDFEE